MRGAQPGPATSAARASLRASAWAIAAAALTALCLLSGPYAQEIKNRPFAVLELRPNDPLDMVAIPAGSFMMGGDTNADERPIHRVAVRSFLMGKTEVTQGQWAAVMGSNPSRFSQCGDGCPVEDVSWNEAQEFIRRLNQRTGLTYRLPSEAEWEYAARADSTSEWSTGNDESRLRNTAWYSANSGSQTRAVGQKLPNAFGLFDMHGNVWEWTQDCWHDNYTGAPTDGSAWTTGCKGNGRVLRGGSWNYDPAILRSAFRFSSTPVDRYGSFGLRLARTP